MNTAPATTIRVRSDLAHRLDEVAALDGRSRSNMADRLLTEGLRRRETAEAMAAATANPGQMVTAVPDPPTEGKVLSYE